MLVGDGGSRWNMKARKMDGSSFSLTTVPPNYEVRSTKLTNNVARQAEWWRGCIGRLDYLPTMYGTVPS